MDYRAPPEARTQRLHMRYLDQLREIARRNRLNPTESENRMWQVILRKEKIKEKFTRQKPLGRCILDFYCSKLLLAIEIDGDSHDQKKYLDKERDLYLEQRGIMTIRYQNDQVLKNINSVFNDLMEKIKEREKYFRVAPLSRGALRQLSE